MSAIRPLETRLPDVLEELSAPRTPAYFDDILGQVGRTRQRPRWTFIERWLPVTTISERLATTPRVQTRLVLAVVMLLLALVVSALLIAGSQRPSVPAPFGVASNGEIAFADETGAIRVGDLAGGSTTVIVPGSGHSRPVFSPDGRSLAYLQSAGTSRTDIVVSDSNGRSPRVLNAKAVGSIGHFGWAPDSTRVVAVVGADILAFDTAGTGLPKAIFTADNPAMFAYMDGFNNNLGDLFRPPNGDEILFVGRGPKGTGVYRQPLAGGAPIPVVTDQMIDSTWSSNQSGVQWSPDGRRIVLSIHPNATPDFGYAYIVNADGTGLRRVSKADIPGSVIDEEHASWSPDGTKIAFGRWINDADGNVDPRPVIIVDLTTGDEIEASNREVNGYHGWSWSPDGSTILEVPGEGSDDATKVMEVDAKSGQAHEVGWTSPNAGSWQRTLPAS
jgi:dipeptidyl aminopeptidase/acylaminoacyl peptidase